MFCDVFEATAGTGYITMPQNRQIMNNTVSGNNCSVYDSCDIIKLQLELSNECDIF